MIRVCLLLTQIDQPAKTKQGGCASVINARFKQKQWIQSNLPSYTTNGQPYALLKDGYKGLQDAGKY